MYETFFPGVYEIRHNTYTCYIYIYTRHLLFNCGVFSEKSQ